jgi:hypothetical protein
VSPSENRAEYRLTAKRESGALADLLDATRDGAPVMIKLFQELSSDAAYARSIAETSRALANAQHPGIVRDLDVGVVRKRLAVVRPSIKGVPLGAALQKLNTREVILPTTVALAWTLELLELLQRAHDAGVVHGGITPGNVLLTDGGKLVLCDFGALRALFEVPGLKKGMLGGGRGGYRAPEVAIGELPTVSADIYSVGALLYELLTLREPGGGKDSAGGRGMHTRREQLITPSRIDRRLNGRIDPVVMRALDFTATRRYRSAVEFISALRNFLAESGGVPSAEELARVVGELTVTPPAAGPPPFTEPFTLEPIEGGVLAGVGDRTMVFTERPAFSGGQVDPDEFPEDAATTEAPPAFEAFHPEATRVGRGTRPAEMPKFEDTEPSRAGPLEVGWVAPPGEAPRKKEVDRGGKSVVRPRVKVIEDFSVVEPVGEPASELSISRSGKRPRDATAVRAPSPRDAAEPPRPDWRNTAPEPDEDAPGLEADRPLRTDERRIVAAARRNRRFLLTVSGLSLLGALCFAGAIWKLNSTRGRPGQTDVHPVTPPQPAPEPRAAPPPRPVVAPVKKVAPPPVSITWDDPPARRQAGYLNVRANVPAYVYIDGARVKQHTPLRRYRVRPGHRKIVVEAVSTGDRHEFTVVIQRGRTRSLEELDLKGAPR